MQPEIEAKFLNVDHETVRVKLQKLGAICEQPMRLMRRVNMDFSDHNLADKGGWLRLRNEGDKTMLAYKQLSSWDIHGVKEVQVEVADYDTALTLLKTIGLEIKAYQETKRETWQLGDTEIVLDLWPWTKPYIEIEGPSEARVQQIASQLGFDWQDAAFGSVEPVYIAEYDITIKDFYKLDHMTFEDQPPAWLAARLRKITV